VVVMGRASDGVIESIEVPGHSVLGIQWHPEWMKSSDPAFEWIVTEACRQLGEQEHAGSDERSRPRPRNS
jgi:putative glutamine amidotransferase